MKKNINAFTLVELVIVITVIAILAGISILSLDGYQKIGRDAQRSTSATVIASALENYYNSHGDYPSCSAILGTTSPLTELDERVLVAPQADAGVKNSITCTDLTGAAGEKDSYAFIGDSSTACVNGLACLQWTLKYREEQTNTITSISSKRQVNLAASGAPVLNAAAAGFSRVDLSWSTVADAGGYSVQYATNSSFSVGLVTQSSSTTALSITGLTSGTTYYFRVQGVNGLSKGNWSNIKSIPVNFTTLNWKENTGSGLRSFYGATLSDDGTKMAAVNYNGYIYTSTDSGVTWTERTSSGVRYWNYITSSADGTKLAATDGNIYTSSDSGATWVQRTTAGTYNQSVEMSSDGTKIIASGGTVIISTNSGASWTDRSPNASGGWGDVASSPNGAILSAKQGNSIHISTNSGATWVARLAFSSSFAISADGTKLVTGAYPGYIYTSTNSGVTWTERTAAGSRDWRRFSSSSDGSKLVALDNSPGLIYTSIDSGATWVSHSVGGARYRQGIDSTPDGSKIIIGPSYGPVNTGVYSF